MDANQALKTAEDTWEGSIIPALEKYIFIPNQSPGFDKDWKANGHMDRAADLLLDWARQQPIPGLVAQKLELDGRTPILLMEVPATSESAGTVLLYGHYDKQPECGTWRDGLSPWKPVRDGDRLYGRGGADDGYAMFASLTALRILAEQGIPHGRIVVLIEGSEESGSPDLPAYVEAYRDVIGTPELVICLDSGNGNYDQLWATTSLRGVFTGNLTVSILSEGVHS